MTPEPLLPRVAAGDPAAIGECVRRYGPLVWGLARRGLGAGPDAEDVVQEVFVELWKSAGRFDAALGSEPSFVAVLTHRRVIDARRRAARRPAPSPLPDSLAGACDQPCERAGLADEAALAGRALAELPADQRRVIRLAVCEGWTHERIAAETGAPLGTVKTHIRRGLIRVRELLEARRRGFGS